MKTKEKYLEKSERKVKNLLSELYESESKIQKEIIKTKGKLEQKISSLETQYNETTKMREEFQKKFEQLKSVSNDKWEKAQKKFDILLQQVEGDKETFITKAKILIDDLEIKIQEIEENMPEAASNVKYKLQKEAKYLKTSQKELQKQIDTIENDATENWRELQQWFIEKSKSLRGYIESIQIT